MRWAVQYVRAPPPVSAGREISAYLAALLLAFDPVQ
jgi:hypothetical protein